MKTPHLGIIVGIVVIITSVTFGSYVLLNPIVSNYSNSQNVTITTPPNGPDCHKWTQGEWITVPCSTPSLPH